ncbi:MAG: glycerophosphoryl diester phosphodiesterase membrane domain-containing protein [Oscillibacter sp.]|nr:glycerophosphoryl diester phosphodiesterase membrane domain-containing protein [Oscillibacter sp.]
MMKKSRFPVWQLAPEVLKYQVVTKLVLAFLLTLIRMAALALLSSAGRVAVSSGDYRFLFTTWQGPLIILLFLTIFFFYVSIDLNVKILYSGNVLSGVTEPVLKTIRRAAAALPKFFNLHGLGVVLYVTLISPVVGVGLGVSLTQSLRIPNFISSVIETTPLYNAIYTILVLLFAVLGISHIFCLHGTLLDGLSIRESRKRSTSLIRRHWRNYLWENLKYILWMAVLVLLAVTAFLVLPLALLEWLSPALLTKRFLTILILLLGSSVSGFLSLFITPFYILRITRMYRGYLEGRQVPIPPRHSGKHPLFWGICAAGILACSGLASLSAQNFDVFFPSEITVQIIAHRGGGSEGTENTVSGLHTAAALGAFGSEIDIQRTADGYYIVNHDANFLRTAGDSRTPSEMTLSEIRKLRVQNSDDPVATFEEMLEAARDRILLFVELKGASADRQMCDDAVKMIRDMGMTEQTVLISLKYELIDYIETTYPEIQTGYLTFLSYGNTTRLHCDYLGLEEESATASAMEAVHQQGKKVLVWTPNTVSSQEHFLVSHADAIITDNIVQAKELTERLEARSDLDRITSALLR